MRPLCAPRPNPGPEVACVHVSHSQRPNLSGQRCKDSHNTLLNGLLAVQQTAAPQEERVHVLLSTDGPHLFATACVLLNRWPCAALVSGGMSRVRRVHERPNEREAVARRHDRQRRRHERVAAKRPAHFLSRFSNRTGRAVQKQLQPQPLEGFCYHPPYADANKCEPRRRETERPRERETERDETSQSRTTGVFSLLFLIVKDPVRARKAPTREI